MAETRAPMMAPSMRVSSGPADAPATTVPQAPLTNAPLIPDAVDIMVSRDPADADLRAFVLSVCAGYAYADPDVLRTTLLRLGLKTRCVAVPVTVDAMYIRSTAFVIQSEDRRLVVVAYRGTEPANVISWLADFDTETESLRTPHPGAVHAGFYRNLRASRFAVVDLVDKALDGLHIDEPESDADVERRRQRSGNTTDVEAIHLAGHSFGGALAILLGLSVTDQVAVSRNTRRMPESDAAFGRISERLHSVHTYGQPMIGDQDLADGLTNLPFRYVRYVQANDLVPHLPPADSGTFAHFGTEIHCDRRDSTHPRGLVDSVITMLACLCRQTPARQTGLLGIATGVATLAGGLFPRLRSSHLHWSLAEHAPHHYIRALAPSNLTDEFG